MSTTNLHRPEPLGVFLDRGGDPREALGERAYEQLAERTWENCTAAPAGRADSARLYRELVEASLRGETLVYSLAGTSRRVERKPMTDQESLILTAWTADLLDDIDALGPRLRSFADPKERADIEQRIHKTLHPNPLQVERQDGTDRCSACGDVLPDGDLALAIGSQTTDDGRDYTEPVEGQWCYGCVAIVYEALKAARG